MTQTFFIAGLACLIAAIVGGGLKAFGIEIPLLSSRTRQILLGLLGLILIVGGIISTCRPTPQPLPPSPQPKPDDQRQIPQGGPIHVRCTANPHSIQAGGQVEIRVLAFTEQNSPVANAHVRIESGGGWFSTSGTTAEVGQTDADGVFMTRWRSPEPAAAAYVIAAIVTKDGFTEGKAECSVPIQ